MLDNFEKSVLKRKTLFGILNREQKKVCQACNPGYYVINLTTTFRVVVAAVKDWQKSLFEFGAKHIPPADLKSAILLSSFNFKLLKFSN